MKYYFQVVFILAISFLMSNDANAQLRKKTTSSKKEARIKEKEDKPSFLEEINPELRFGNLGFFNGLSISTKMNVGYKISERFTAGIGGKLFYDQLSAIGPDPSITSYGGLVHARGKITNEIYIQGEYAFMDYERFVQDQVGNLFIQEAKSNTPLIGLGYMSGTGNWRFGVELLYIVNDQAREFQGAVIEYWFGASYNF